MTLWLRNRVSPWRFIIAVVGYVVGGVLLLSLFGTNNGFEFERWVQGHGNLINHFERLTWFLLSRNDFDCIK